MCTLRSRQKGMYLLQYSQYVIKNCKITGITRVLKYESTSVDEYESRRVESSRVREYKRMRVQL